MKKHVSIALKLYMVFVALFVFLGTNSQSAFAGTGSKSNVKTYTYTESSSGVTDIKVTTSKKANITIYTKTLVFFKSKVTSKNGVKSFNYTADKGLKNTYVVEVTIADGTKGDISVTVNQHQDTKYSPTGGRWVVNGSSKCPDTSIIYREAIFFSPTDVSKAIAVITDSKYLARMSDLTNGTMTLAAFLLPFGISSKAGSVVASFFGSLATWKLGVDFQKMYINRIKEISGYNAKTQTAKYGVRILYGYVNGINSIVLDKWTGSTMKAPAGYLGTWK